MAVAKISALAVDEPFRRTGIGAALLSRVRKIYFYNGYLYVYGQMPDRPGLAEFYARQGFEVRAPGEGLDLRAVFGIHGTVHPEPDERLFIRKRPQ